MIHLAGNGDDVPNHLSYSVKQCVKAGSLIDFMDREKSTSMFTDAYMCTHPLQVYLNRISKAEKLVNEVAEVRWAIAEWQPGSVQAVGPSLGPQRWPATPGVRGGRTGRRGDRPGPGAGAPEEES